MLAITPYCRSCCRCVCGRWPLWTTLPDRTCRCTATATACLQAARELAQGKPRCEAHVAKHGGSAWQPVRFVALCEDAACSRDAELLAFAEGVMAAELRLLLDHCYAQL